jgi:hypothetical protein
MHGMNHYLAGMDFVFLASALRQLSTQYGFNWFKSEWHSHFSVDNNVILHLDYEATFNGQAIYLDREIFIEDYKLIARHVGLVLPRALQGRGISRRINSIFYSQYKVSGVTTIRLEAGLTDGGYVWAGAGFYATNEAQVREILDAARKKAVNNIQANRTSDLTPALCDTLQEVVDMHYGLNNDAYFPMHTFSDLTCGEEILKDTQWSGELNLANKPQTVIFDQYLNK